MIVCLVGEEKVWIAVEEGGLGLKKPIHFRLGIVRKMEVETC